MSYNFIATKIMKTKDYEKLRKIMSKNMILTLENYRCYPHEITRNTMEIKLYISVKKGD